MTNTTFRMCPWADVVYGFDAKWWRHYGQEVRETCTGKRLCGSHLAPNYGAEWYPGYKISGASAVMYALSRDPSRIVLLGYDACLGEDGAKHHHADHPAEMGNCESIAEWPSTFAIVAKRARVQFVEVVNASRRTSLVYFPLVELEDVL